MDKVSLRNQVKIYEKEITDERVTELYDQIHSLATLVTGVVPKLKIRRVHQASGHVVIEALRCYVPKPFRFFSFHSVRAHNPAFGTKSDMKNVIERLVEQPSRGWFAPRTTPSFGHGESNITYVALRTTIDLIIQQLGGALETTLDAVVLEDDTKKHADSLVTENANRSACLIRKSSLRRLADEMKQSEFTLEEVTEAWKMTQVILVQDA